MFVLAQPDVPVSNGAIALSVLPESIYTIASTTGQIKGKFSVCNTKSIQNHRFPKTPIQNHHFSGKFPAEPAVSAPFPAKWSDDFDAGTVEGLAKYWADQCGSFQVMPAGGGRDGNSLLQRVTIRPGANKWAGNLENPLTALGNPTADTPIKISVDVRAPKEAFDTVNNFPPVPAPTDLAAPNIAAPTFKYQAGRINGGGLVTYNAIASTTRRAPALPFCNQHDYEQPA